MKLKFSNSTHFVKPKQTEGKLRIWYRESTVKPKRVEPNKLRILTERFLVQPKQDGVKLTRFADRVVLKQCESVGVQLYRKDRRLVLKTDELTGIRLYKKQSTHVLKQTCDGTIFTWDAAETIFRPPTNNLGTVSIPTGSFIITSGLLTRIYDTERPIVIGVTWSNTISGGTGGVNFPDGTYTEVGSPYYHLAEIRTTPTAVNNSAGSVPSRIVGLTGMSGVSGVTFTFNSAAGNFWLRFGAGTTGTPPYFVPSGTKQIRDYTVRNVSNNNSFIFRFLIGWRVI